MIRGEPRTSHYMGMTEGPHYSPSKKTWIEAESMCYPSGGMCRRARAFFPDGRTRVGRCGIPDTYFSIPAIHRTARHGGFLIISEEDQEVVFHFNSKEATDAAVR